MIINFHALGNIITNNQNECIYETTFKSIDNITKNNYTVKCNLIEMQPNLKNFIKTINLTIANDTKLNKNNFTTINDLKDKIKNQHNLFRFM